MNDIPILDGEELWASKAIDDTDSLVRSLLNLTNSCINLKIKQDEAKKLHAELSLYNATCNIELKIDKWLTFCAGLSATEVSIIADEVRKKLNDFSFQYK